MCRHGALAARALKSAALEALRVELERLAVLVQGEQLARVVDDVNVRGTGLDAGVMRRSLREIRDLNDLDSN